MVAAALALGVALGVALGTGSRAIAQGAPASRVPCRALLIRPGSAELQMRIEGQSRDVACTLQVAQGVVDDANEAALATAARGANAHAVIMIEHDDGYAVIVWHTATGTRERRAVNVTHAEGDALGESAAFEAIALVVRSALLDLATLHAEQQAANRAAAQQAQAARDAEATQKQQAAQAARDAAKDDEDEDDEDDEDEDKSEDESDSSSPSDPSQPDWRISAGAELAAIGADGPAVLVGGRVVRDLSALRIGVAFTYGLAATLEDASTEIELRRHMGVLLLSLPLHVSRRVTLDGSLATGVVALSRSTRARATGVAIAQDVTAWSAAFGVEVGGGLWLFGPLALRLHGGLDVVPGAPSYAYEDTYLDGSRRTELASPSVLQPRGGLMLTLQL